MSDVMPTCENCTNRDDGVCWDCTDCQGHQTEVSPNGWCSNHVLMKEYWDWLLAIDWCEQEFLFFRTKEEAIKYAVGHFDTHSWWVCEIKHAEVRE